MGTSQRLSQTRHQTRRGRENLGFTLVEVMIVVAIVGIVAALTIARLANRDDAVRLGQAAAQRVRERRAAAIQLNSLSNPTRLQNYIQPPVTIDFTNLETTRGLRIDGVDADGDGVDDNSGQQLTRFVPPEHAGSVGSWSYAYQGEPLQLPAGWRIVVRDSDLGTIPTIPLGVIETSINFTPEGKVGNQPPVSPPDGKVSIDPPIINIDPNRESPFPAIYFTNGNAAIAIAVHVTGPEFWQWDQSSGSWLGYANRMVGAGH